MEEDTKFGVLDAGRCTAMHVGARGDRPIFPHFWGMAPASAIQVSHDLSAITDPWRGLSVFIGVRTRPDGPANFLAQRPQPSRLRRGFRWQYFPACGFSTCFSVE